MVMRRMTMMVSSGNNIHKDRDSVKDGDDDDDGGLCFDMLVWLTGAGDIASLGPYNTTVPLVLIKKNILTELEPFLYASSVLVSGNNEHLRLLLSRHSNPMSCVPNAHPSNMMFTEHDNV